ncbi:MAG: hypothetical protein KME14_10475 [Tildeniella torsiva UHER 1998/13D]|nr:hypothetical protein [Tildeniella torsiva UHER 1998/13D]
MTLNEFSIAPRPQCLGWPMGGVKRLLSNPQKAQSPSPRAFSKSPVATLLGQLAGLAAADIA